MQWRACTVAIGLASAVLLAAPSAFGAANWLSYEKGKKMQERNAQPMVVGRRWP